MFISIRIRSRKIIVRGCGSSGSFREYDIRITVDEVRTQCDRREVDSLVDLVVENNPLLSYNKVHLVKPPSSEMDQFGYTVVVIKEENEITRRVISAIKGKEEHCIIGDVRYNNLVDRVKPDTLIRHSMTVIYFDAVNDKSWLNGKGTFGLSLLDGVNDIIWRGCMDKYSLYANQREWRLCWIPNQHNHKAKRTNSIEVDFLRCILYGEKEFMGV